MPSIDTYNEPHLQALASFLADGQVTLLVGAGTSIACGYPGWSRFMADLERPLARELGDPIVAELRRNRPDFLSRVDRMIELLGGKWPSIFTETFAPRGTGEATPEWIRILYDVGARMILTTNYSIELEQAAKFHPSSPLGRDPIPIRWWNVSDLTNALRRSRGRCEIIYLHGRYDDNPDLQRDAHGQLWSQVVLGEISYQHAYHGSRILTNALDSVARTSTLLLVGSSLLDDDMRGVMRGVRASVGHTATSHFAVLPMEDGRSPTDAANVFFERFGLRPIYYPLRRDASEAEDHSALEAILRDIAGRASSRRTPVLGMPSPTPDTGYPPRARVVHHLLAAPDFEARPEYQTPVHDFISGSRGGVLALVGIGGSGKTSIIERELVSARLPADLRDSDNLFVWSFYEQPSATDFMRLLMEHIVGAQLPAVISGVAAYDGIRRTLLRSPHRRLVIIMDGLEKLQRERREHGDDETYGVLDDQPLRQLLMFLGSTEVAARAIVTTRFPLRDLDHVRSTDRITILELDSLTRSQARRLLRRRGVVLGSDRDCDELVDRFGAHALTIDHLAGVLVAVAGGDAREWQRLGVGSIGRYQVGTTWKRLASLLRAYGEYLRGDDPIVQAALEAVAVFVRPVTVSLLERVFLNPRRAGRAGILAGCTQSDIRRALDRLTEVRLLHIERIEHDLNPAWTLHPAIRDSVIEQLGESRAGRSGAVAETLREDLDRLIGRPRALPTSRDALDLLEETIEMCLDAGELRSAFELYWYRLGSFSHVGRVLGDYARGVRLCRLLVMASEGSEQLSLPQRHGLTTELGLFLQASGLMSEAHRYFMKHLDATSTPGPTTRGIRLQNASGCELFLGNLAAAQDLAERAVWIAWNARDDLRYQDALSYCAAIRGNRGSLAGALADFAQCRRLQNKIDGNTSPLYSNRGSGFLRLLLRCGRSDLVRSIAPLSLASNTQLSQVQDIATTQIILAAALHDEGLTSEAVALLDLAEDWSLTSGHQRCMIEARLVRARIALDANQVDFARSEIDEGLSAARLCAFGLLEIEASNLDSEMSLLKKDPQTAKERAMRSLALSSSSHCDFFWGRLVSHELLSVICSALAEPEDSKIHRQEAEALRARVILDDAELSSLLP